jgi:cysteinyl-tRNA synthetase
MSAHHLGDVFDIHGGGLDLIFPHHENEIAQACCANDTKTMANYWMHNGFLQVEGRKMSKSAGNFFTIQELLETENFGGRKWPGEVLRLAMLMTNYREPIDFSKRKLEEAENLLSKWPELVETAAAPDSEVVGLLADDLNTAGAIQALHALAVEAGKDPSMLEVYSATADLMGLAPVAADMSGVDEAAIKAAITRRLDALKVKDWGEADSIRAELTSQGILLKDSKDSETGERVTTWEMKR